MSTTYIPSQTTRNEPECISYNKRKGGWNPDIAPDLVRLETSSKKEITLLRHFDLRGNFIGIMYKIKLGF